MFTHRMDRLRKSLAKNNINVSLITDEDSIYYFTGYYDYLHMEFGRPTILVVPHEGESILITPNIEFEMAQASAMVDSILSWNDGLGNEWREKLPKILKGNITVAVEKEQIPQIVFGYVKSLVETDRLIDLNLIIAEIRMIKSAEEIELARHTAEVAKKMMQSGAEAIGEGIPEYEVALAISAAGTRKSAELLLEHYNDERMSPNIHFLQIMASGKEITMPHHRASTKIMIRGEPVFICLCGITNFNRFKLGFDRTFWIEEISDKYQETIYQLALKSQSAALSELRPGARAEDIHAAYAEVIQSAGFEYPFRCSRGTGFSFLEKPQLVFGDKTILKPGMILAVDGSVSVNKRFRAQVGDSFIITEEGYEQLTNFPKNIHDVIIN